MVTCPGVAQAKTVARKVFESGGELLHYEGQKCVNLPCNTTNTVLQVLAMAMTPECNRVEEKSLEEMIMIMSVNVIIIIIESKKQRYKYHVTDNVSHSCT